MIRSTIFGAIWKTLPLIQTPKTFSTSSVVFRRGKGIGSPPSKQSTTVYTDPELRVFREQKELSVDQIGNIHLNPAAHSDIVKQINEGLISPENSRTLRVNILGVPNSGKSTLINQIVGYNVCPHSRKVHTTRSNTRAILTEGNTQIVFLDTPGIVSAEEAEKFKLEESLLVDPAKACKDSDLILVIQDVSNRYVRETIDKRILKLLCFHSDTPAILVLNKLDVIPKTRSVYDLIRKLTCGYLSGVKQKVDIKQVANTLTVDTYLKRKKKEEVKRLQGETLPDSDVISIRNYEDFMTVLRENPITDSLVTGLTKGLVGWPNFKEVFTVSALKGDGIDDLREYLFNAALPAPWSYSSVLNTDDDPRETVKKILKSKFLEVLPTDLPYKINPLIQTWSVENGVLRLGIQVDSNVKRCTALLLNNQAENLSKIARLAETDLQNFFQCEVFVYISINVQHETNKMKARTPETSEELWL